MDGFKSGGEGVGGRPGVFQEVNAYFSRLLRRTVHVSWGRTKQSRVAYLEVHIWMTYRGAKSYRRRLYWIGWRDGDIEFPATSYELVSLPARLGYGPTPVQRGA